MGISKVLFNECAVMDISDSTVTADSLLEGKKAYNADGEPIVGTMKQTIEEIVQGGKGFYGSLIATTNTSVTSSKKVVVTFPEPLKVSGKRCYIAMATAGMNNNGSSSISYELRGVSPSTSFSGTALQLAEISSIASTSTTSMGIEISTLTNGTARNLTIYWAAFDCSS